MNKYSKRALKTTATVGMSLAMVLSAAAPVMAATGDLAVCSTTDTAECRSLYLDLAAALKDVDFAEVTMDSGEVVKINDVDRNVLRVIGFHEVGLKDYADATAADSAYVQIKEWLKVTNDISKMFGSGVFSTYTDAADEGYVLDGDLKTYDDNIKNLWATPADAAASKSDVITAWKAVDKFYNGNYNRLSFELQAKFDGVYNKLSDIAEPLLTPSDEVTAKFVDAWTKVLEADMAGKNNDLSTVDLKFAGLTNNDKAPLNSKSALNARIKALKAAPDYEQVKNESGVISIIEEYEALIANLGDLKDLLKGDSFKAYGKTKTDNADMTVQKYLTTPVKNTNETLYTALGYDAVTTKASDDAKYIAKNIDSEQFDVLEAAKEEVLDVAFNFDSKKVGDYYLDKGNFSTEITPTQVNEIKKAFPGFLFKVVDTETGEFGYDYVANHMAALKTAMAAVTKDVEKLTPANIKASDKKTLEAAEDALYELTSTKGKFVNNLTDKEARSLRAVEKKIEGLREAFDKLGTTEVAGWYDMGNGNWGYNNEDGTPAAYKWVAAGSDWYFVRDGKMARNTWLAANSTDWYYLGSDGKMATSVSVDGCWINSLGIYRR